MASYRLELLGGVRLIDGGQREIALPSRRACALLACIAVDARSSRVDLAERLWPGPDLASARRNLRRELARLREAGLADVIDADTDHVTLGPAVDCDVARFLAACQRDEHAEAVALWRGPLLDGFALSDAPEFDAWLQSQRDAVAQRWRHAAAAHAERLEGAGALRDALLLYQRLCADDPLQERHWAHAMRLHHRLGERAAALDLYAQCERVLREELDARPSPATIALAERIRAAQELQPIVARAAVPVPLLDAPLIGRDEQAAALRTARAPVLLVTGDAGVGKTRLVQDTLRARSTLSARCESGARDAALYPMAEALRLALQEPARLARVAELPIAARREAARLLPALCADAEGAAPVQRERFFDALGDVIDRAAGDDGVLWIDDLHWADDATLDLMAHLAHRRAAEPSAHARIVCAARSQELEAHPSADALLRRLERAGLVQRLALEAFDAAQTLALVRALSGTQAGTMFASRLQRATHGNPFHLMETLRFLFDNGELRIDEDGAWATRYDEETTDYAELPVPPTLAATVLERADRLGPAVRQLVEAAALTRSGFTLAQIQPATSLDDWQAVDALESALRLQLIAELHSAEAAATHLPGYRFAHDLAREALAQSMRPERRRLVHDRLARALIAQQQAADHIAWHLEEAGHAGEAVPWRLAAARESRRLFAWRGELAHLRLAWAATTDPTVRIGIVRDRLDAARRLYDFAAMGEAVADLDLLAQSAGDAAWPLEALVCRAEVAQLQKRPQPAIEPLRAALESGSFERNAPSLRPRAVVALAQALLALGQVDAAQRTLGGVDVDDDRIGIEWRAALLTAHANAARMGNDAARAQPLLRQAIALLQGPERVEARLHAQNLLAHTQYSLGDAAGAITTLEASLDEAERAQLTVVLRTVLPNLTTLCTVSGQLERAQQFLERGMHTLRYVDNPATLAALQGRLAELRLTAGDLGGCIAAAHESIRLFEANGGGTQDYAPWVMLELIYRHAGAFDRAVAVFEHLPASAACAPGPAALAIARLKMLVARLPIATREQAARMTEELSALREAPDAAYTPQEVDYWRAQALLRAGDHAQAAALAQTLPHNKELGLFLYPACVLALRVSCQRALGATDEALVAQAQQALTKAPPLPALELAQALGDSARVAALLDTLTANLADHPDLAEGLLRRWGG